ncbi:MAG: hypothetical protein IT437_09230 [Phycisphaerales bacterium]|nr:hypothetical protein [Phycisphaerales bacterium]
MNGATAIVLVLAVTAAIIAALVYGAAAARKRREEMAALGVSLGWSFDPENDPGHDERFGQFGCFTRGHSRAAYNSLSGALEADGRSCACRMGDYTYKVTRQTGKTTTTTTHTFSYLVVVLPFPRTPDLSVRREGFMDKIAQAVGFDDIDFESAEFSRRFSVKSADKRFAYGVIHPRMMEFLMAEEFPGIDLRGGAFCLTDGSRTWRAEQFRAHLDWARRFLDLWPEHLTKQLEASAPEGQA